MDLTQDLRQFLLSESKSIKENDGDVAPGDVNLDKVPDAASPEGSPEGAPKEEEQVLVLGDKFEVVQDEKGELVLKKVVEPPPEEINKEEVAPVPAPEGAPAPEVK